MCLKLEMTLIDLFKNPYGTLLAMLRQEGPIHQILSARLCCGPMMVLFYVASKKAADTK